MTAPPPLQGPSSADDRGDARAHPDSCDPLPTAIVFCERLDNESFCQSIVNALEAHGLHVRPCGPGWLAERLADVDPTGARFYLELDAASGSFVRPHAADLAALDVPKFAWLIDTHKKLEFHRQLARDVDLTFFAMKTWGHVFDRPAAWLPLHADARYFHPVDVPDSQRRWDLAFVGSQTWRAEPIERLARKHGLSVHVSTTTGPREKSETAAIYVQARLVFNRHVTNDLNFRTFEATACGRVLLSDAQPNGQYDLFEDGRHLVLYKDEADLERHVLRLLGDPELRATLEREAALHALAHHTTTARVAQLLRLIDAHLAQHNRPIPSDAHATSPGGARGIVRSPTPATARGVTPPTSPPLATEHEPRRWLVLSPSDAPTTDLQSYSERLARSLAARGHEVVLARCAPDDRPTVDGVAACAPGAVPSADEALAPSPDDGNAPSPDRGTAPSSDRGTVPSSDDVVAPSPGPGNPPSLALVGARLRARGHATTALEPSVFDLDPGPLPRAGTAENRLLAAAGPLHHQLDDLAREHGPFDAILAEGLLGQLVGPALARRLGVPLLLALPSCEVLRRHNQLKRDQLYLAELEHWAADRATAVLCPWNDVADAVRRHYRTERVELTPCPPPTAVRPDPADARRLAARLGLEGPFALALGLPPTERDTRPIVWSHDATTLAGRLLSARPLAGPALAALLALSDGALVAPCDPARADAYALAPRVAVVADASDPAAALRFASTRHLAADPAGALVLERLLPARQKEDALVLL